jgi:hypothetical protein
MRPMDERVYFAFHTEAQRSAVAARLSNNGFTYQLQDEPSGGGGNEPLVIVIP